MRRGQPYFSCDLVGKTTYTDPRGLPPDYELRLVGDEAMDLLECYVDRRRMATQWQDPRVGASTALLEEWFRRDLTDYLHRQLPQPHRQPIWTAPNRASGFASPSGLAAAGQGREGGGQGATSSLSLDGATGGETAHRAAALPDRMCLAAHEGACAQVAAFLAGGGDINAQASGGAGTLLMFAAAAASCPPMIDYLLREGADVHAYDCWGCTPLAAACCPMKFQPLRMDFLRRARDESEAAAPALSHTAAGSAGLSLLSEAQAGGRVRRESGESSSSGSSRRGLDGRGGLAPRRMRRADAKSATSAQPLASSAAEPLVATPASRRLILERLLCCRANPNVKDHAGYTPLVIATIASEHLVVRTLLAAGADTEMSDGRGMTALDHATDKGMEGQPRTIQTRGHALQNPLMPFDAL